VEDYETNAEEISRTIKIKHTKKTGKKIQNTTGNKTPNNQPERLGQDLAGSNAEEGGDGRKARWGRANDLPHAAGYENAEIWKTKAGKKANNKKKRKGGKRGKKKKKGRNTETRASSK
jgi:hypothetical protein